MRFFAVVGVNLAVCLLCTLFFTSTALSDGLDLKGDPELDGLYAKQIKVKFPRDLGNDLNTDIKNDIDPFDEFEEQVQLMVQNLDKHNQKGDPELLEEDPRFSPHNHKLNYPVAVHHRQKRGFFKGIGRALKGVVKGVGRLGKGLLGGVLNIGGMLFGRGQAQSAAAHYNPSMRFSLLQLCNEICVTEWTMWTPCSKPCGGGIQERTRTNQLPGQCAQLKDFKCHKSTHQQKSCNEQCPNGGLPSEGGCNCQPGWSGTCCHTRNVCEYPGKPRSGRLSGTFPAVFRAVAQFECNPGYSLEGEDVMHCQADGNWRGQKPSCAPIQCSADPPNENIILLNPKQSYLFGEEAIYRCREGYVLEGPSARKCHSPTGEARGRLTGYNPTCKAVKCEDPGVPVNGQRTIADLKFGATANFTCSDGFKLVGPPSMRCLSSGSWLGRVPTCDEIKCDPPYPPRHGGIQLRNARSGATVLFECDDGFELLGERTLRCMNDGYWNGVEPKCKAINCGNPGVPEHGYKDGSVYTFDHTVTFRCFNGFTLQGSEEIRCQQDATWSNPIPTCKACPLNSYMDELRNPGKCIPCGPNSHTTSEGANHKQNCLCNEGFEGPPGGPCIKIECPPLSSPVNGQMTDCSTNLGSTCSFTCDPGYILHMGASMRTCQKNAQWDGDEAKCSACPEDTYKSDERSCLPCPPNSFTNDTVGNVLEGCVCRPEYTGNPGGPCTDIDECVPNGGRGPCEQTCENRDGGYMCGCNIPGYGLDTNLHNCKVDHSCKNLTKTDAPLNGGLVCHHYREQNSKHCAVKCNKGFEFPSRVNNYELCSPGTGYTWTFRKEDPEAEIPPCIEQFYPDLILQAETAYFVAACDELTEEQKMEVKSQFVSVLNENKICERREEPICLVEHVNIVCGARTTRRKKRGAEGYEELNSIDFSFNVSAIKEDETVLSCPKICTKFRIPERHCENLCWSVYSKFLKASVMFAERQLKQLYKDPASLARMRFRAAQREFEPEEEGVKSDGLNARCPRGMQWIGEICVPCFAGSYYDEQTQTCMFCPPGMYQMLRNMTYCDICPNGTSSVKTNNHTGPTFCLECDDDHYGEFCEQECACVNGICNPIDGTCICESGWEGERCDMDVQGCVVGSCFEGVTCSDVPAPGTGFRCGACPSGFHGDGARCAPIGQPLGAVLAATSR